MAHRLYRFSNGNLCLQYGQGNYANISLAKTGARLEEYVLNPALKNATFFGWWIIESTATNTGGTALTDFIEYNIGTQGGSSNSLSGCLLKGNNLSDLLDKPVARKNLRGYNTYTALFSYDGTSVTLVELENTIGSIVFTRNGTGDYTATLTGAFTDNKTFCFASNEEGNVTNFNRNNNNTLDLDIFTIALGNRVNLSTDVSLEIRVYD